MSSILFVRKNNGQDLYILLDSLSFIESFNHA